MQLFRRKEKQESEVDNKSDCFVCKKPLIEGEYFRAILFDQYKNITDDPTNTSDVYAVVEMRIHTDCVTNERPNNILLASLMTIKRNMIFLKPGEQPPFQIVFNGKDIVANGKAV